MLLLSFLAFFAVYLGFAISTNAVLVAFLFVLYGLHSGPGPPSWAAPRLSCSTRGFRE